MALGLAGLAGAAAVAAAGGAFWFFRSAPRPKTSPAKSVPVGTTLYTYQGHVDIVYAVAWSRDGKNIASWSRDDTMQVWNATTFAQVNTYPMENVLAWSPDWRLIASGTGYNIQVWEVATGRIMIYYEVPNTGSGPGDMPVNSAVQWSPNGKYIASAMWRADDSTHVWDVTTGKMLVSYPLSAVAWSPDGKRIALLPFGYSATNAPVKLQIVDVATQNQLASYMVRGSVDVATQDQLANYMVRGSADNSLLWSPNGKYLASGSGDVWDAATGQHLATHKGQPLAMVWSPDSQYLAAFDGSQYGSQSLDQQLSSGILVDRTVHIWNALTGEDVFVYRGHTAGVNYVAWSPDGSKIASASSDMTVKVWQATPIGHITGG
jgi:WD40 repeat protein